MHRAHRDLTGFPETDVSPGPTILKKYRMRALVFLAFAAAVGACSPRPGERLGERQPSRTPMEADTMLATGECRFPSAPTAIETRGNALLQYWEFDEGLLWSNPMLPADPAYAAYRRRVEEAGADQARPSQHVPEGEQENENWRRELHNVSQAYGARPSQIRSIECLDALVFAYQNNRFDQIYQPTEFISSILRKQTDGRTMVRIYWGAGDELFPPKDVYGFDEVGRDVSNGWEYVAMLHNHTIQEVDGQVRLGVPAPSVSDVQLLRGLAESYGLERVWVTNGFYTLDIPSEDLDRYLGPE